METPELSRVAAAIGEPARGRMLQALLGGRALTATELAGEAGVAASTASSHLARLLRAGLVRLRVQGRHRYFQLASPAVAELLERLLDVAVAAQVARGPRDPRLRRARVCYDHLAGELGVALHERLGERGLLVGDRLSPAGEAWLVARGIAVEPGRRPLVRVCLDWSERRDHLAGRVGAAILGHLLARGWARREPLGRALAVGRRGERFLTDLE